MTDAPPFDASNITSLQVSLLPFFPSSVNIWRIGKLSSKSWCDKFCSLCLANLNTMEYSTQHLLKVHLSFLFRVLEHT
jgi:hypothetical protein